MQKLIEPMMCFRNAEAPAASRGFHVETRSPISWLQHDSLEELKECADPMLTPAPLQHTQQCSCSKGLFNIQITTASAICRTPKIRCVFIAQTWILQKHRRELSTPISASVNFIFARHQLLERMLWKREKTKHTHRNFMYCSEYHRRKPGRAS